LALAWHVQAAALQTARWLWHRHRPTPARVWLHRTRSIVPMETLPPGWLGASPTSFTQTLHTVEGEGQFPRPGHSPFHPSTVSPWCWQVTVGQMLSACHLLGKPLGSLAMVCFGEMPPHPQTAWETVDGYRNNDYKGDPESGSGGIAEDFLPSCQRQDLICCQTLESLGKSLLWCPPWKTGSHWR